MAGAGRAEVAQAFRCCRPDHLHLSARFPLPLPRHPPPTPGPGFWTWKSNPHLLEQCRQHMLLRSLVLLVGSSVPQTCSHPEQATCF